MRSGGHHSRLGRLRRRDQMQGPQDSLVQVAHPNMAKQNLAGAAWRSHDEFTTTRRGSADVTEYPEYPAPADPGTGSAKLPGNLTVLLLDDHAVMLESVREIVETDETLTVVGTADRVADAVDLAARTHPQVAVIDVNMPDGGGWAAARGLREVCPDIRLVAYSSFDEALVIRTIRAAGISAFVTKGSDIDVLLAAIHGEDFRPAPVEARPLMRRTAAVAGN